MRCRTCGGDRVIGCIQLMPCPDCTLPDGIIQLTINTLTWMTTAMKLKEDDLRGNLDDGTTGGYSEELTKALELLEKWKGLS